MPANQTKAKTEAKANEIVSPSNVYILNGSRSQHNPNTNLIFNFHLMWSNASKKAEHSLFPLDSSAGDWALWQKFNFAVNQMWIMNDNKSRLSTIASAKPDSICEIGSVYVLFGVTSWPNQPIPIDSYWICQSIEQIEHLNVKIQLYFSLRKTLLNEVLCIFHSFLSISFYRIQIQCQSETKTHIPNESATG